LVFEIVDYVPPVFNKKKKKREGKKRRRKKRGGKAVGVESINNAIFVSVYPSWRRKRGKGGKEGEGGKKYKGTPSLRKKKGKSVDL